MQKIKKEFKKLKTFFPKNCTIYLEIDLIKFRDFFLKNNKDIVLKTILKEFLDLKGKKGNLIVPAFTYSWGKNRKKKIFDINNTRPKTGMFPNFLFNQKGVLRTKDPMFSFLILGKDKKYLQKIGNSSFGKNSLFDKINLNETYLVSFGLNKFDPTFVHYVEEKFDTYCNKIKYRYIKKFKGFFLNSRKKFPSHFYCFSRNIKMNKSHNEKNIKKILLKKKKLKIVNFFGFEVYIVKAEDYFNAGITGMKKNRFFFAK